jgi:hypothetical protein
MSLVRADKEAGQDEEIPQKTVGVTFEFLDKGVRVEAEFPPPKPHSHQVQSIAML